MSVGELAARTGRTVSALPFFEREGLLTSTRTTGNPRRYPRDSIRRVALVQMGRRVGIPLARIREALGRLPAARPATHEDGPGPRRLAIGSQRAESGLGTGSKLVTPGKRANPRSAVATRAP